MEKKTFVLSFEVTSIEVTKLPIISGLILNFYHRIIPIFAKLQNTKLDVFRMALRQSSETKTIIGWKLFVSLL